jgi:3-methyladenine DNA glycosylase/8-oxoguanine DNA glycosylase
MNIFLPARQPFSLSSVIHSHGWIQMAPYLEVKEQVGFAYTDQLPDGSLVAWQVSEAPGGVSLALPDGHSPAELAEIKRRVSWMLGLEMDFSEFYALASQEAKLHKAVQSAAGRILRSSTLFEDVIKTILTTNTLWAATIRMNRNLVEQFGAALPEDESRKAFPLPSRLAQTDEATLREKTRLGYRAPYVLELARLVDSGSLDLEAWTDTTLPTVELRKRLLSLKGVGPYAVANLLMLLGRYDTIPVDSWAVKVVSHEWYHDQPVGKAEVEAAFEAWGEWKGLAFWLWDWAILEEGG